jgi:hypothetical protein
MKPLSWRPRRYYADGLRRYCAPACGHACTEADHSMAKHNAAALAKQLGKGWRPIVWENLGWHYKAKKGDCEVHCFTPRRYYWCSWMVGGHQFQGKGRTAPAAFKQAARAMISHASMIDAALEQVMP